jgi:hypothetical protein
MKMKKARFGNISIKVNSLFILFFNSPKSYFKTNTSKEGKENTYTERDKTKELV